MTTVFSYTVARGGHPVALSRFTNEVTLIVNTASQCSFTNYNIHLLNDLQKAYESKHFTVLAFPCAQFGGQEPLSNDGLAQWVEQQRICFPVFDRVSLKGKGVHPLFQMLQRELGSAKWNYTKFLCSRDGIPHAKYDPAATHSTIARVIEQFL
ncbi:glutathione peroxidase [Strigomonas culicis]|uniref:Glutathione peroxidase n=1 Tax=Strigomonas culicis TaxID=28005 RepID=S9VBC9_9TRYP|nr:glutathione peroxidase [Strigomonas culicis]EPY28568.1 glutathione peroxidase [Strigomonas culicis]EPY30257.1 glutathione peroxidase [Strigomonas culicis]|eukprot:EPY24336.1 glutathione peroxidase [Strigomonas culicis]